MRYVTPQVISGYIQSFILYKVLKFYMSSLNNLFYCRRVAFVEVKLVSDIRECIYELISRALFFFHNCPQYIFFSFFNLIPFVMSTRGLVADVRAPLPYLLAHSNSTFKIRPPFLVLSAIRHLYGDFP